ncbi:MAG: tryptophan--tRNA ligase [Bacteroidales bacterium]|jgi:tryptophanyl-tRNA synthetase|nr:tryptophan--tRNA ligase [Bacteroidales bacterium]MCI1785875.1 tryptophan--tRNA ligase [Bacteroidales bacterium]
MDVVLSGIRATGHLHLGNYFGALRNFVKIQDKYNCFYFIADLHSLTTHPHPEDFHQNVKIILTEYLAAGLDPDKCTIYVQSDVPEICELYTLLNMLAYKGELERTAAFKDKVRKNPENVNAGLLTYPVLMASDILIHRSSWVPVGKDQDQHLEMARTFARRFNNLYGTEVFPEPHAMDPVGGPVKVPGLDGNGKMGKSEGNGIYLCDDEKTITKKVMRAVTDAGPKTPDSPKPEVIDNLFTLMKLVSTPDTVNYFEEKWNDCSIRYGDMKKQLAEDICKITLPIRARIDDIANDSSYLHRVVSDGRDKARASASATLEMAREAIGIKRF